MQYASSQMACRAATLIANRGMAASRSRGFLDHFVVLRVHCDPLCIDQLSALFDFRGKEDRFRQMDNNIVFVVGL